MDASPTQAFDACLKEALAQTREWTPRWLDKLRDALYQREGTVTNLQEKQALVEARTALEGYRDRITSRFLEFFAEAVHGSLAMGGSSGRKLQTLSFDELELMGDEQVQETVELARVQQVVKMAADEELVALNTRMSSAQGHARVRPEANPLRTEIVIGALMRAINGLHVDPVVRSRWLQMGAVGLGSELQKMYAHLSRQLDRMGVRPAGYNLIQAPDPRAPVSAPVHTETVTADSVLGSNALLTLDHLHQLLIGNLDQSGDRPSDQGVSGSG
ncbi:MAG TPA: DUF1631 family protein, partial [Hydrogenophaga sp.]|nr:DUF1631 family protein [Hydrogenophaga sp.]